MLYPTIGSRGETKPSPWQLERRYTTIHERILLMGPPGGGKSTQLINTYLALKEIGVEMALIDFEDKLEAMFVGLEIPLPKKFFVCLDWEEYSGAIEKLDMVKNQWIGVDRIDLSWDMVQRWYSIEKYNKELSEQMMVKAKAMRKAGMFTPRFDQGDWQPVNENYATNTLKLIYKSRCNIIMTAGIKSADADSALDVLGSLGVTNRGQKELQHQPHSTFLLHQKKRDREIKWYITTGKDLEKRRKFESEEIFDFFIQYISQYMRT